MRHKPQSPTAPEGVKDNALRIPETPDDEPVFPTLAGVGRNPRRMLLATVKLIDALQGDADPLEAMKAAFEDIAEGFGAERAILLVPGNDPKFQVVAYRGEISPAQLAAISRGESAHGISSTTIQRVVEKRAVAVIQHPLHRQGARRTASLGENYSVLCAPVLDASHTQVRAVFYFQNTGPSYDTAYQESDTSILEAFVLLAERIFSQRETTELQDLTRDPTLTRDYVITQVDRQLIENRLDHFPNSYETTAESLGISRAHLYRMIDLYGLQTSRGRAERTRTGERIQADVHGSDKPER